MPFAAEIKVDQAKLRRLIAGSKKKAKAIKRNVAGALYDTAKSVRTDISSQIREHVAIKKADVDGYIRIDRPSTDKLVAGVTLSKTDRIPLKYFGARQTRRGVTYRIAKSTTAAARMRSASRTAVAATGMRERIPDAFGPNIPRLGGNVFRRTGRGRLPIVKLHGPSPWGVFVRLKLRKVIRKNAHQYLMDRLERRIKYQK